MSNGKEVYIVGGGSSLKGFDFSRLLNKETIAVNMSIFDVPNPNYFITVDYTFLRKMKGLAKVFPLKTCPKFFVVDLSHPYLIEHERRGCVMDNRFNMIYNLSAFDVIIKARKKRGIGSTFGDFRTGLNSGYCALQLAVLLGYTKIYLLGIDLNIGTQTHYHNMYGAYPDFVKKLMVYFYLFKQGIEQMKTTHPQIEVISCSKTSSLNSIINYLPLENLV